MKTPHLYIIAGPNGSGKTTFAQKFLPRYAKCTEFVNADLIAKGLSPFRPETAAIRAGRLVLLRIRELGSANRSFGFETTLSGKAYAPLIRSLKQRGYIIHVYFLWVSDPALACRRVADRVKQGGHDVPADDIRRRYKTSARNFFSLYEPLADSWVVFDNSGEDPILIAQREDRLIVSDRQRWDAFSRKAV